MKKEKISEALNGIDETYVEKAANYKKKKTFMPIVKWGTLAASLAIVIAGSWVPELGLEGAGITINAFQTALPFPAQVSAFLLMICLMFFAFTTILGWDYYPYNE